MLRIGIVGGSLGGLTAALLLRELGHEVYVYERSPVDLTGYGAGIVAHEVSLRCLRAHTPVALDALTVPVGIYRLLDGTGALLAEERVGYRFISWGRLYRALLDAYGRERYFQGMTLSGFEQDGGGVDVRFSDGAARRFDLLVLADGVQSTGRRLLFPGVEPVYAGYVAWRGTVAEHDLPASIRDEIDDALVYVLIPHSHILVYPIPGADGSLERGRRLWNFVWYRNVAQGAELDELMTDREGVLHSVSLRPGRVGKHHVGALKTLAAAVLPPQVAAVVLGTDEPFIQAVMDVASPAMAVGRVCLIGDAAFAARPHAAAGTAKAAENAWTLAEAVAEGADDLPLALAAWSEHQTALGRHLVERARHVGDGSQFRCDWRPGDPALRFGLYAPGDSSIWTRSTRSSGAWPART